jgi:L-serine/L-threonine ammonia-lyase
MPLSKTIGAPVYLKMESFQPVGSFKARGMGMACLESFRAGRRHVVCSSGGNAGYAVAYASRMLGMRATIVVPESTSPRARELILSEGAELIVHGKAWDDSHALAMKYAQETESKPTGIADYIHPFDDPRAWKGHSTIIDEIAEAGKKPGLLVVSVGGGGLLCGLLEGMHRLGWQDVPVLAVETEGAASYAASVKAGHLVTLPAITSIATTLGARTVASRALEWFGKHPITPWVVTDRQAVDACLHFADDHRVLVEPACGASLSVVYEKVLPIENRENVLAVVCGGAGVTLELLDQWDRLTK